MNPQSFVGFIIELGFGLFNCLFCFFYSLIMIFPEKIFNETNFNYIVFTVWIIEILIRINTITYSLTSIIEDRVLILNFYLRQRAFFDIIPLILINVNPEIDYVNQII